VIVVEDLICATTSSGSGRIVDDVFWVSYPDMYSMLLFILSVPSKYVVQGGRHFSLEQLRLSKDANIDISVGKMPMCDGESYFLSSAERKACSGGEKRKGQEPRRHQALGIRPLPSPPLLTTALPSTTVHNAISITDSNTSVGNPTVVMSINA
jgi:hypothetical protein